VFDTWGGALGPAMYREFSLPYLTRIARALKDLGAPVILFGKGNAPHLDDLFASGADAIGVDWTVTLEDAARRANGRVALQGNLDPAILYGNPDAIRSQVQATLDSYATGNGGSREGHVFNLGHGMSPDMDPGHVAVLVEAVHALNARRESAQASRFHHPAAVDRAIEPRAQPAPVRTRIPRNTRAGLRTRAHCSW
jgi:uroporphyrinogen decarboxylase